MKVIKIAFKICLFLLITFVIGYVIYTLNGV